MIVRPTLAAGVASSVATSSATLNGEVNPENQETSYHFEYGTSTSYGSTVPFPAVSSGSDYTDHAVAQAISGLEPSRIYHYRLVATNASGTSQGADQTFTTSASAPVVSTNAVSSVATSSATLNGEVNPENQETSYHFEYGTSTSYGSTVPFPAVSSGSDYTDHAVAQAISGLERSRIYHYRLVATNASGTSQGADQTFTTSASAPVVSTNAVSSVATSSATLNGEVNPENQETSYHFEYGTSTNYSASTPAANAGSSNAAEAVSAAISGLAPSTSYHFRLVATSASGTINGADQTFTTAAAPSPGPSPSPRPSPSPAPSPGPSSSPPPSAPATCSLATSGNKVLLKKPRKGTTRGANPGTLTLKAKCNQAATVTLRGVLSEKGKKSAHGKVRPRNSISARCNPTFRPEARPPLRCRFRRPR